MGANAALHCRQIVENVRTIIAIELMSACQALDFRLQEKPVLKLGQGTAKAYREVRAAVPFFEHDAYFKPGMDAVIELVRQGRFCS